LASLNRTKRPFVKVFVLDARGNRDEKRIYLTSSMTIRDGLLAAKHIQELANSAQEGVPPHASTKKWLDSLSDKFHARVADKGLTEPRDELRSRTLEGFLHVIHKRKADCKNSSLQVYGNVAANLKDYFGPRKRIEQIKPAEVDAFRVYLETKANRVKPDTGLSPSTVEKRLKTAREFFGLAVENGWISKNPFAHLKNLEDHTAGPDERKVYIERSVVERLIEDADDTEWRLLLALWRFAGLRQTEPLSLTWEHISWGTNRMTVLAPKQRSPSKRLRVIPIWPEVKPWLDQQYHEAPDDGSCQWVIWRRRYEFDTDPDARSTGAALYSRLQKQLIRNGIIPWPRLTQNLRCSGETERSRSGLWKDWEIAYWWNHDVRIQRKHYLQVTDDAFDRAVQTAERVNQWLKKGEPQK
jgi:integrase